MRATQTLPPGYRDIGTLDINKNERLLLLLNLAGMVGLAASGWLFLKILSWLRPHDSALAFRFQFHSIAGIIILIGSILALLVLHVILHEAVHGVFFWLFTRSRPRFAFRWTHAYAAAPDWYIPRNAYLVTALAPLVLISLAGILLFAFGPFAWLLPAWFVVVMNAGGAVGDLLVAGWLLRQPAGCLAQDRGDAVTLYVPENK